MLNCRAAVALSALLGREVDHRVRRRSGTGSGSWTSTERSSTPLVGLDRPRRVPADEDATRRARRGARRRRRRPSRCRRGRRAPRRRPRSTRSRERPGPNASIRCANFSQPRASSKRRRTPHRVAVHVFRGDRRVADEVAHSPNLQNAVSLSVGAAILCERGEHVGSAPLLRLPPFGRFSHQFTTDRRGPDRRAEIEGGLMLRRQALIGTVGACAAVAARPGRRPRAPAVRTAAARLSAVVLEPDPDRDARARSPARSRRSATTSCTGRSSSPPTGTRRTRSRSTIVQGDTQLDPAKASIVAQSMASNSSIVGVIGPAGSQEVTAAAPILKKAGLAFVSGSATNVALTDGKLQGLLLPRRPERRRPGARRRPTT